MHFMKIIFRWIPVLFLVGFVLQAVIPSSAETTPGRDLRYNMSYIYFGDPASYVSHVDRTKASLDEISPNYFNVNPDGSLAITKAFDPAFVDEMHERGIFVVPFLSNHWDRKAGQEALAKREELAENLAEFIETYGLDGINVDLENLTERECDLHTDFIRLLREKLGDDKIIGISVAANPYGVSTGWKGSYDYEGLATYSDYLMIMAYDEHYQGSEPGTVASLGLAEKSIQYALSKVPKEKILLGIPFYGRIWKNGGGFPQGVGIGNEEVRQLILAYGGRVTFDKGTKTPSAEIVVNVKDDKPRINGKQIEAGSYTIWFEDETSIKEKLKLVEKYRIKGTGSWSLAQETEDTWRYFKLRSNGCYFEDAGDHWARDAILQAYRNHWIRGVSDAEFSPDRSITRAEAVSMLVRLLELPDKKTLTPSFRDTEGHWAQVDIERAKSHGLINGSTEGLFKPEVPITREETAVMLQNILNSHSVAGKDKASSFTDVTPSSNPWSWQAIEQVSRLGIVRGFGDGSFRPKTLLSRAQMTVIMGELERVLLEEAPDYKTKE